jgi:hypothetical protein
MGRSNRLGRGRHSRTIANVRRSGDARERAGQVSAFADDVGGPRIFAAIVGPDAGEPARLRLVNVGTSTLRSRVALVEVGLIAERGPRR